MRRVRRLARSAIDGLIVQQEATALVFDANDPANLAGVSTNPALIESGQCFQRVSVPPEAEAKTPSRRSQCRCSVAGSGGCERVVDWFGSSIGAENTGDIGPERLSCTMVVAFTDEVDQHGADLLETVPSQGRRYNQTHTFDLVPISLDVVEALRRDHVL